MLTFFTITACNYNFWCYIKPCFARWCNGSTTDSGSVCLGSNPGRAAILQFRRTHTHIHFWLHDLFFVDTINNLRLLSVIYLIWFGGIDYSANMRIFTLNNETVHFLLGRTKTMKISPVSVLKVFAFYGSAIYINIWY